MDLTKCRFNTSAVVIAQSAIRDHNLHFTTLVKVGEVPSSTSRSPAGKKQRLHQR